VIFAHPPVDGFALAHFDDWIELVVVHELAHIHHLDVTGLPGRVLRGLFGRVPAPWPFFPGQGSPGWVREGLATWYESSLTAAGRTEGAYLDMILRAAALEDDLDSIDRASGRSPIWPGGQRAYAYGSHFFDWLLARHGEERMAEFVRAVGSQWIPYRLNSAARSAFGVSFGESWETWRGERVAEARAVAAATRARGPVSVLEPLTEGARLALHGRVGPDGTLAYARNDGRSDSQLRFRTGVSAETSETSPPAARPGAAAPAEATERGVRTNGLATFDWVPASAEGRGPSVVATQFEVVDEYRVRSDLYLISPSGETRRLTHRQRVEQPSTTPDGTHAWAVQAVPGTTRLVRVSLASGDIETLPALPAPEAASAPAPEAASASAPEAASAAAPTPSDGRSTHGTAWHWGFPAVSPDGRRVAAIRWVAGRGADLVVLDARDGSLVAEVTRDAALELAPAWAPDGTLLWVSDRTGIPNLYATAIDPERGMPGPVRQVTDVATGVAFPSVDPVGRWIVLSHYGADGWDLARLPYDPATWADPLPPEPALQRTAAHDARESARQRAEGGAAPAGSEPLADSAQPHEPAQQPAPTQQTDPALDPATAPVRPYRAWHTLRPRFWEPIASSGVSAGGREVLGPFLGLSTTADDAVQRHSLSLTAALSTTDARAEGRAAYTFRGLGRPLLGLSADQNWDAGGPLFVERDEDEAPDPVVDTLYLRERERRVGADVTLRHTRFRRAWALALGGGMAWEDRTLLDARLEPSTRYTLGRPTARLGDLRLTLSTSSARAHEYSFSPEAGWSMLARVRSRREFDVPDSLSGRAGGDRAFDEALGWVRAYQSLGGPGFADHVFAIQIAGGAARGPGADAFHFDAGGSSGQAERISGRALLGGRTLLFPIRGYADGQRSGRYAWSGGVEWRFPLALVNRGWGLFPLHLDRVHGALFADAGNAWGPELDLPGYHRPRGATLVGVGAELRTELLTFYTLPMTVRVGFAQPLVEGDGGRVYVRLGPSF
jgi:hypothetical protein